MSEIVPFIGPFSQKGFVCLEHLIQEYVCKILEELRNSKLHRYNWAVHRPFCEDIEVLGNYFVLVF